MKFRKDINSNNTIKKKLFCFARHNIKMQKWCIFTKVRNKKKLKKKF